MSRLRIRVGSEWIEVDPDEIEVVGDDAGEVVDAEIVMETVPSLPTEADLRRERLRSEAAWLEG